MRGKLPRIAGAGFLLLAALLSLAQPVRAATVEPDTVSLDGIVIFRNLIATGDFLAFVPYNVAFTTAPDENIDDTYIFKIINSDNFTDLGQVLAYPAYNGGYGSGAVSFYFSTNMSWGVDYIFRVQQNPTYYPSAQKWDFTSSNSSYSSSSDQAAALKAKVLDSATFLSTVFDVSLLATSESGQTILSAYGEDYYLNVIPGLQTMCPALFSVQLENPDYTKRSWDRTFADALLIKYQGTFLYDAMTGFAGLFDMDTEPAMAFLSIIAFSILVTISMVKCKASVLSAFVDGYALLLLLMLMGMFSMIFAGGLAFLSTAMGGVILFLNKA